MDLSEFGLSTHSVEIRVLRPTSPNLWGCPLKLRHPFFAVLLVCIAALTVRADGIPDGSIKMGRGSDPSNKSDFCGLHFTISLNGNGGGIENCINTSGQDWIGLEISAVIPFGSTVNCVSLIFSGCTVVTSSSPFGNGKEDVTITLSGGADIPAGSKSTVCAPMPPQSPPLSCFFINLNNGATAGADDAGGWLGADTGLKGGNLKVDAITAPEPSTILLMGVGLGILSTRRRMKSFR